jgi:hypothetical protein
MFATALLFCLVPVVLFGLMLETCQHRARGQVAADPRPRGPARLPVDTLRVAA